MISKNYKEYHQKYMHEALFEARKAFSNEEVPVGAIAVYNGEIIARGHNKVESSCDPTAHAEMVVIKEVAAKLKKTRLTGINLYVTLEPCAMCAGAILKSRIDCLIFGAYDDKLGAVGSNYDVIRKSNYKTDIEVIGGILETECSAILKVFFEKKR